jgi:alpha-L-fucosidase
MNYEYVENFKKLGFGMFVHFGLYSVEGCGEWGYRWGWNRSKTDTNYFDIINRFRVKEDWAKNLVETAKNAGCKYITLTTRHHEGFSLYDTKGLSLFDSPHSATGRDLIREFVDECNRAELVPFFYHTCFDWHKEREYLTARGMEKFNDTAEYERYYQESDYFTYWLKSVEILCTQYGKIGGFWFDGLWMCPNAKWPLDELYAMIRKYQPTAMIINNTGLDELGKVGHPEIDSVTFERGKAQFFDVSDRPRAGEVCQALNDHWGYTEDDLNYKTPNELIETLVDCRKYNCNFLLNVGPLSDGELSAIDRGYFQLLGRWIKNNKGFLYESKACDVKAENAYILQGNDCYYAVIKNVPVLGDPHVVRFQETSQVRLEKKILSAEWLDNGEKIAFSENEFKAEPFAYGNSGCVRIAKLKLEK